MNHSVWHVKDQPQLLNPNSPIWVRLDLRLSEMLDRRRRLIKYTLKKEGRAVSHQVFDYEYKSSVMKKQ